MASGRRGLPEGLSKFTKSERRNKEGTPYQAFHKWKIVGSNFKQKRFFFSIRANLNQLSAFEDQKIGKKISEAMKSAITAAQAFAERGELKRIYIYLFFF